jgi:hypothetical protein
LEKCLIPRAILGIQSERGKAKSVVLQSIKFGNNSSKKKKNSTEMLTKYSTDQNTVARIWLSSLFPIILLVIIRITTLTKSWILLLSHFKTIEVERHNSSQKYYDRSTQHAGSLPLYGSTNVNNCDSCHTNGSKLATEITLFSVA